MDENTCKTHGRKPVLKPVATTDRSNPALQVAAQNSDFVWLLDEFEEQGTGNLVHRITDYASGDAMFLDPINRNLLDCIDWLDLEAEHGTRVKRQSTTDVATSCYLGDTPKGMLRYHKGDRQDVLTDIARYGFAVFAQDAQGLVYHPSVRPDLPKIATTTYPDGKQVSIMEKPADVNRLLILEEKALRNADLFGKEWPHDWTK